MYKRQVGCVWCVCTVNIVICALVPFGANLPRPNLHEPGESLARGTDMVELFKTGSTTINLVLIIRLFKY